MKYIYYLRWEKSAKCPNSSWNVPTVRRRRSASWATWRRTRWYGLPPPAWRGAPALGHWRSLSYCSLWWGYWCRTNHYPVSWCCRHRGVSCRLPHLTVRPQGNSATPRFWNKKINDEKDICVGFLYQLSRVWNSRFVFFLPIKRWVILFLSLFRVTYLQLIWNTSQHNWMISIINRYLFYNFRLTSLVSLRYHAVKSRCFTSMAKIIN